MLVNISKHICFPFSFSRATLYVGKYSTSLYASPSLVHDGVTVVVSHMYIITSTKHNPYEVDMNIEHVGLPLK